MDDSNTQRLVEKLETKSLLKQKVYDNTLALFEEIKETLHEINGDINDTLQSTRRIKVEYRDRGKFEAQIQVASDILIFSMHTNVFKFNRDHAVNTNNYVLQNSSNKYCGIINIYNFLADSFKYNRQEDEGYLIGRIFINHENSFFVEGKGQRDYKYTSYGSEPMTIEALKTILFSAMNYSLDFDLLTPSYDSIKIVEISQMNTKIENSLIQSGKRLGYSFNSDDI